MSAPDSFLPSPIDGVERVNPYVGPRSFKRDDPLYGRDKEASELVNLLIAQKVVVLHSPSGAGKTSLVEASVVAGLEEEGFVVAPRWPMRLGARPPEDQPVRNRYVWSALMSLFRDDDLSAGSSLNFMRLAEGVAEYLARHHTAPEESDCVLLFDQFEELLTTNPADLETQNEFFDQLGQALTVPRRWALISIREDHVGALERFANRVPTQFRTRYRLENLDVNAARIAISKPASNLGVAFDPDAVQKLFDDLSAVHRPDGQSVPGPYVVPVQLQVVCFQLWQSMSRAGPFAAITLESVAIHAKVEKALRAYYASVVATVASNTNFPERSIRDWFEKDLISPSGVRTQTMSGPKPLRSSSLVDPAKEHAVLDDLEAHYLIRGETRGGNRWYELAHDRFVDPVKRNNERWRWKNLHDYQIRAAEWVKFGHRSDDLLPAWESRVALKWLSEHKDHVTDVEQQFIETTRETALEKSLVARYGGWAAVAVVTIAVETVVLLVLALLLWR